MRQLGLDSDDSIVFSDEEGESRSESEPEKEAEEAKLKAAEARSDKRECAD